MNRTRRRLLAAAVAGACLVPMTSFAGRTRARAAIPATFDDVDHFDITHKLRDGWQPPQPAPSAACDIAIVGGGISALTAAYRLRARDICLLEKETETGGNSRARAIAGCRYALGAFMNQGPIAPFTDFFHEIGVDFAHVPASAHAYAGDDRLVRDPLGRGAAQLPGSARDKQSLAQAVALLQKYTDAKHGVFFPRSDNAPALRALDERTLWQEYERLGLTRRVRNLFDTLVSARVADSGERLSAWMGSYLLSSAVAPNYTLPGGHAAFAERLRAGIAQARPQAIHTGFTVTRVSPQASGKVWVSGIDSNGAAATIEANGVILGVPKFYAFRIVDGLAAQRSHLLRHYSYNAYLVAQVFLRQRLDVPFETMAPTHFTRFIVAPDQLAGNQRQDGGGVLTVYIPYPRREGRTRLYLEQAPALAQRIAADIEAIYPAARGQIEAMQLHRWGHPMLTAAARMDDTLAQAKESVGCIAFAHSDSLGVTGLYSAIWSGMEAEAELTAALMT